MIRVLQFADLINRHDFIDVLVQNADRSRFLIGVCTRTKSNIAEPDIEERTPKWLLPGLSRGSIPRTAFLLARSLREWRADILHTHHYDQAFIGWLATRFHPSTRLVVGRHYSDSLYRLRPVIKRRALLGIERMVNKGAARIIVPSQDIVAILTRLQGIDRDKIDLIPYGFEPRKYEMPSPENIRRVRAEFDATGRFIVGTFARLHSEKGHAFLLKAAGMLKEKLPSLLFLLLGDGPERAAIEKRIKDEGLERSVRLAGMRRDAMLVMAAVDAIVQPSLHEAFSQVMVEAMFLSKPLVITSVSGARDIIRDGENGILIPPEDALSLAGAIERLAADPSLCHRLGSAGRQFALDHLTIDKVIPQYEQAYFRALELDTH